ncbi:heme exporter protein CcmD [Nitrospirillum sp. BR 11164]|uniref:heme exporter protein CcmD n=1 Tax=Nitrospirillum sp. BR 11164 TaxID=3104324 RepID=UPI002AFDCF76|nr:heme exporter protein CcmD [Nitrospirillum sp. BR 11164]MEA1649822.1 heme exporter protein CcmD [Nitrospirillum sp. BR 11164]
MDGFLSMGGYAAYVWSSYGAAAVVLVGLLVLSLTGLRRVERTLATLEAAKPRRRRELTAGSPPTGAPVVETSAGGVP